MTDRSQYFVVKRSGEREPVFMDKITERIANLSGDLPAVDPAELAMIITRGIYPGVKTTELDDLAAQAAAARSSHHPDFEVLASRLAVTNIHKQTLASFSENARLQYEYVNPETGEPAPQLSEDAWAFIQEHAEVLDGAISYERDLRLGYFGVRTLERSYLMKRHGVIAERPQQMFMRVAVGIHGGCAARGVVPNLEAVLETYDAMSQKLYTHATPTLFNSGTPFNQMSSCFLLTMAGDSIDGIFDTLKRCALISKYAGGIGLSVSTIRSTGSYIRGTNGSSNGIIPMLRVFNDTARYVDQGGGKRKGSIAIYVEPWHADVMQWLDTKKNQGSEELRCRDLFMGLWIPDLFMQRVSDGGNWSLFCPNQCPGLSDVYGEEFETLYTRYESEGLARHILPAQEVFRAIVMSQIETGGPYMVYKDAANQKSNQKNLGTIRGSNLCVAPETPLLTQEYGYKPISEMHGENVHVWNGDEWSPTTVVQTNDDSELMEVRLSNGMNLSCTLYHKFVLADGKTRVDAQDLQVGTKLVKFNTPVVPDRDVAEWKYPYTHGLFCADGTMSKPSFICQDGTRSYHQQRPLLRLYGDKQLLLSHLDIRSTSGVVTQNDVINVTLPHDIPEKFTVPVNSNMEDKLAWFAGFCDGDGCVTNLGNTGYQSIQVSSSEPEFLRQVMFMLQTMGLNPKIRPMFPARQALLPDGKGGKKMYDCKPTERLIVSGLDLERLINLGFSPFRLSFEGRRAPTRDCRKYVTVESLEFTGRRDRTFCVREEIKNMAVFGGMLTGQCTEILEYTSPDEVAVCNLASINLTSFMGECYEDYDFDGLADTARKVTKNLNRVIDVNFYPIPEAERSNFRHRPIGIGVQGLADVFHTYRWAFDSSEARKLNKEIFEAIYYGAVNGSIDEAEVHGPYVTYEGSPASQGLLQFDMWDNVDFAGTADEEGNFVPRWDWTGTKARMAQHGLRNSLLVAPMPTASTSQILGNNECFEPYTSNLFSRRALSGDFAMVNRHLVKELIEIGEWGEGARQVLLRDKGSVKNLHIPQEMKHRYRTVWEMKMRALIDMSADRAPFVCQTQSLNLYKENPSYAALASMHMHSWRRGLKTGMYYLHTREKATPVAFTLDSDIVQQHLDRGTQEQEREAEEGCVACSA